MCGIVGYIGNSDIKKILLDGLAELEYRGYDSAGIAVSTENGINDFKAVGKLKNLVEKTKDFKTESFGTGIGHTRWATHGKPTELNAHPHSTTNAHVVHNGIIENYGELKKEFEGKFISQTDTEVIVHLFEKFYKESKDSFRAFEKVVETIDGAYAILLVTEMDEGKIFFAKKGSPLQIGTKGDEIFFASSDAPLIGLADEAIYLEDNTYGYTTKDEIKIYENKKETSFVKKPLSGSKFSAQKEGYKFFMEKEIYEQSTVLNDTILGRVEEEKVVFEELENGFFEGVEDITICACGTSYHAGLTASYLFGRLSKVKTAVEIASEFRYKDPVLRKNDLFIVISQSGETADTLEALKMAKKAGLKTLAICNVDNSSIVREADGTVLTRAGIEKGVASTKAFSAQVTVFWLLALFVGQSKNRISIETVKNEIAAVRRIREATKVEDRLRNRLHRLSKRYLHGHGFFFIGRDLFYPLALEGALKLKEISYLHAEGYPSGEMKHGPIALVDSELFTIALMPKTVLYEKTRSNIEELSARDSTICAVTPTDFDLADDLIKTKESGHPMLEFFEMMIVVQILSMEISIRLGNDVDMPRNLAKSVTVE